MVRLSVLVYLLALVLTARSDKLLRVQIIARHGARTPLCRFPNDRAEFLCPLAEAPSVAYLQGPEAPTARFQTIYSGRNILNGTCPSGFLTEQGFEQHRQEGQKAALKYKAAGILPDNLTEDTLDMLYLRSTQYSRTRMSLMAEVVGMYPEIEGDPSNTVFPIIHLGEKGLDPLSPVTCAAAQEGVNAILELPENKEYLESLQGELERLNRLAGVEEGSELLTWSQICDNLICRDYMGMDLPPGFTRSDLEFSCGVVDWIYAARYCSTNKPESARLNKLLVGPLLRELYEGMFGEPLSSPRNQTAPRLSRTSEVASNSSFQFYSSHDAVVAPLLGALVGNDWPCEKPPFASSLRIELLSGASGPYLRFWYKDKPLRPAWCESAGRCTKEAYRDYLLENYVWESKEAWTEACSEPW